VGDGGGGLEQTSLGLPQSDQGMLPSGSRRWRKSGRARGGGGLCEARHICRIDGSDHPTIFSLAGRGVAPFPPKAGPQKGARQRIPSGPRLAHPPRRRQPPPAADGKGRGAARLRRSSRSSGQAISQRKFIANSVPTSAPLGAVEGGQGDAKNRPPAIRPGPPRRRCRSRSPPAGAAGHEGPSGNHPRLGGPSWIARGGRGPPLD
jgi:hypothetical protein